MTVWKYLIISAVADAVCAIHKRLFIDLPIEVNIKLSSCKYEIVWCETEETFSISPVLYQVPHFLAFVWRFSFS